ncbi:MAG: Rpn family recombination-promoting nuclease/putative transposase, partial [Pyrinomonadaceae bacterium]|nr:Rpn family recombination-promoting nuclease/putative transposase [Pyrinomonadaceae bacterium]
MSRISEIQNPHDYFIKSVFADLKTARSFLENYLPPEIVARLDFEPLLARGESFVDENLKPSHTDLLYRVNFNANEDFALIYVLLEHKSYADEWTAFQLLRYAVRIWEKEQRDGAKRLPVIIPLVLYHGKNNWRVDTKFSALVENGEDVDFTRFTPHFVYQLCDLSTIDESGLRGAITLRVSM